MVEAIEETRMESLSEPGRPPRSLEAHHKILAAIRQRSPQLAAKTMRSHLREVADVSLLRWCPTDSKDGDR
jgi:GntR family transcriptional regulator, transcriptional repressor for pyruvate dehydrogenase complex